MRKTITTFLLLATIFGGAAGSGALAAGPDNSQTANRYIMRPANGGFIRMDTQTGAISFCRTDSGSVSCRLGEDDRLALMNELNKLKKKNAELKEENRRLEDMLLGDDKENGAGGGKRSFKLPSEKEVDQALGYIERMYKKFRDKFKELNKELRRGRKSDDSNGTGTPL